MKIAAFMVLLSGLMPAAAFAQTVDVDAGCGKQREYWLWPGARLPDQDQHGAIARLYLLQGFFSARGDRLQFVDQGATARPLQQVRELWLVYRLDALPPVLPLVAQMERDLRHWQRAVNRVSGVQLDFDSATGQLADYGQFLRAVRKQLAPEFALGITGLMDWVNQDAAEWPLDAVAEIVLQTYQGRSSVPQLESYLRSLARQAPAAIPYKLGVVDGAALPSGLLQPIAQQSGFRGCVIFLLPEAEQ